MRPAPFEYARPKSLAEALTLLASDATPLAGGQSLLQAMRLREVSPRAICELSDIQELDSLITCDGDHVRIGALATHRDLIENTIIADEFPWLTQSAAALGDVQVRNLGTALGNVCWADPRANLAVAFLASDAKVIAASMAGDFEAIPIADFFTGFRMNALGRRLAVALEIPRAVNARGTYREFSRQRQDLALVNVAIVKTEHTIRIVVGGIDPMPVRLPAVEMVAASGGVNALAGVLADELTPLKHTPIVDQHGSAEFKLELAGTLIRRALVPREPGQHD